MSDEDWGFRIESRGRGVPLLPYADSSIGQVRPGSPGVPAQAKNADRSLPPPEGEGLIAAPHVDVHMAALYPGSGVHDGVDAVVALPQRVDLDDRPDREEVRI